MHTESHSLVHIYILSNIENRKAKKKTRDENEICKKKNENKNENVERKIAKTKRLRKCSM